MSSDCETSDEATPSSTAVGGVQNNFYQATLTPLIVQIILVVVALGLLDVSLDYIGRALGDIAILGEARFWQRIVLLLSVLAFTTYNLISYSAEAATKGADAGWAGSDRTPGKVIGLFLIDLLQVAVLGWMYVSLLVGKSGEATLPAAEQLALEPTHFIFIAALAGCWHLLVLSWHLISGSNPRAIASHAGFAMAFSTIAGTAALLPPAVWDWPETRWLLLAAFSGTVVILFATRGRRVLGNALGERFESS